MSKAKAQKAFESNLAHERHINRLRDWLGVDEQDVSWKQIKQLKKQFRKYSKFNHPDHWRTDGHSAEEIEAHNAEWREIVAAKEFLTSKFRPYKERFPQELDRIYYEQEKARLEKKKLDDELKQKKLREKIQRNRERDRKEVQRANEEQKRRQREMLKKDADDNNFLEEQKKIADKERDEQSWSQKILSARERQKKADAAARKEQLKRLAEANRRANQDKRGKKILASRKGKGGYVDNTVRRKAAMKFESFEFVIEDITETQARLKFEKPADFKLDTWEVEVKQKDFKQQIYKKRKNKVNYLVKGLLPGREYTFTAFPRHREWVSRNDHPGETRTIKTLGSYVHQRHPRIKTPEDLERERNDKGAQRKRKIEEKIKREEHKNKRGVDMYNENYAQWQHEKAQLLASAQSHAVRMKIIQRDQRMYDDFKGYRSQVLEEWRNRLVSMGFPYEEARISCIGSQSFEEALNQVKIRVGPEYFEAIQASMGPSETRANVTQMDQKKSSNTDETPKQAVSKNRRQEEPSNKSQNWWYLDSHNELQGPFSVGAMRDWFKQGFFQTSLFVRCQGETAFVSLGDRFRKGDPAFLEKIPEDFRAKSGKEHSLAKAQPGSAVKVEQSAEANSPKAKQVDPDLAQLLKSKPGRKRRKRKEKKNQPDIPDNPRLENKAFKKRESSKPGKKLKKDAPQSIQISNDESLDPRSQINTVEEDQPVHIYEKVSPERIHVGISRSRSPVRMGEPSISIARGEPSISVIRDPGPGFDNSNAAPLAQASNQPTSNLSPMDWDVSDVVRWVRSLGFDSQAELFEEHEIDGEALLELDNDDLKNELGFKKLGKRRHFTKQLTILKNGSRV